MDKEFIPYEQALVLKELGFNEPCLCFYNYNSQLLRYMNPDKYWNILQSQTLKNSKITLPDTYSAPTFSQCFKWFKEKYGLMGLIQRDIDRNYNGWWFRILSQIEEKDKPTLLYSENFNTDTPEEAELASLRKLIEIVKENKQ